MGKFQEDCFVVHDGSCGSGDACAKDKISLQRITA